MEKDMRKLTLEIGRKLASLESVSSVTIKVDLLDGVEIHYNSFFDSLFDKLLYKK